MDLPDDVEFVFVDDGSDPPLRFKTTLKNFITFQTNDKRPWTQPAARNKGVAVASGEYLICTDIDHIITREIIETARSTTYDVVNFRREAAVLEENADFTQDLNVLRKYGFSEAWIAKRGLWLGKHGNSYIMKRELFLKFGGSRVDRETTYPNRDEVKLRSRIRRARDRGEIFVSPNTPMIYCIPNGRFCGDLDADPLGLFHKTSRREFLNPDALHKA